MALLLSEINPEAQDELFKLGYEWGQSRVIAGFHWQSDVDASRMLAAATYARLHACDAFNEDMEPAGAGEELVGILPFLEEIHERRELRRVFRSDVGSLADEMLGACDTANLAINRLATETGIDDDGARYYSCGLQQLMAAVGQIHYGLNRREVAWVFPEIKEFAKFEMR